MLVDEGRLNLDDPVEKYLPEFKGQMVIAEQDTEHVLLRKGAHPMTVREILSHTSGLPFSSPMEQPTRDRLSLDDAVRSHAVMPLLTEPGTKYAYSNAGINTAARILEVLTGMSYEDFLDYRLLKPLGMNDTTFWPSSQQAARLAKAYKASADKTHLEETTATQLHYPLTDRRRQPMPAGGLFSTASDTVRFCQMILSGGTLDGRRYVSESAVRQMTTKQTGPAIADEYGLGFSTAGGTFGHGGAFATNMTIDPVRERISIYMIQHAGFPGEPEVGAGIFPAFQQAVKEQFGA